MMQMVKAATFTTFVAVGSMASANDVAPIGFKTGLLSLEGTRASLTSMEGSPLTGRTHVGMAIADGKLRVFSGTYEAHINFVEGTPRLISQREQGGRCVVGASREFGPTVDLILQADSIIGLGDDRILFTKNGIALAGFSVPQTRTPGASGPDGIIHR